MDHTKFKIENKTGVRLIDFPGIGSSTLGYISIGEETKNVPFDIKRVYWTYYTPQDVIRGGHAHKALQQIIVAVSGQISFKIEDIHSNKTEIILDNPKTGIYIPPMIWREIHFSHNAVLLCLASDFFLESDYIRDYNQFKSFKA